MTLDWMGTCCCGIEASIEVDKEPKSTDTFSRVQETAFSTIVTDLQTAMTLTRIASTAEEGSEKRKRNIRNARHAHDTMKRLSERFSLSEVEQKEVDERLATLKFALEGLGEGF